MGTTRKAPRPARRKTDQARREDARLERLQQLVDVLLAAALRGHLLPSERRVAKAHLEARRVERHARELREREARGPECPACGGPLPSLELPRCPHCRIRLDVIRSRGA